MSAWAKSIFSTTKKTYFSYLTNQLNHENNRKCVVLVNLNLRARTPTLKWFTVTFVIFLIVKNAWLRLSSLEPLSVLFHLSRTMESLGRHLQRAKINKWEVKYVNFVLVSLSWNLCLKKVSLRFRCKSFN